MGIFQKSLFCLHFFRIDLKSMDGQVLFVSCGGEQGELLSGLELGSDAGKDNVFGEELG